MTYHLLQGRSQELQLGGAQMCLFRPPAGPGQALVGGPGDKAQMLRGFNQLETVSER